MLQSLPLWWPCCRGGAEASTHLRRVILLNCDRNSFSVLLSSPHCSYPCTSLHSQRSLKPHLSMLKNNMQRNLNCPSMITLRSSVPLPCHYPLGCKGACRETTPVHKLKLIKQHGQCDRIGLTEGCQLRHRLMLRSGL